MVDFDNVSNSLSAGDTVADCLDDGLSCCETSASGNMTTTMATDIMRKEEIRLQTFQHWPTGWGAKLARYGFCSVSDDVSGSVRCVFCGTVISDFVSPEEANFRHWQSARLTCRYLRGENVHNVPLEESSRSPQKSPPPHSDLLLQGHPPRAGADQSNSRQRGEDTPGRSSVIECGTPEAMSGSRSVSQPGRGSGLPLPQPTRPDAVPWQEMVRTARCPAMAFYQARLKTLSRWPLQKPSPTELAKAGFFHVRCTSSSFSSPLPSNHATSCSGGRVQTPRQCGDSVRCFWCGETIHHWERTDDALLEHARLSPSCVYVIQVLGQELHDDIVSNVIATRTSSGRDEVDRQVFSTAPVRSTHMNTTTNSPSGPNRPPSSARPARPQLTSAQLDELMLSPPVQTVLQMGFPPHLIRDLLSHNSERLSADTLCSLALQAAEHTPHHTPHHPNTPHSPSPGEERPPISWGRSGDDDDDVSRFWFGTETKS